MALDVYVGSLTRYHAGEWETVGEKAVRERNRQGLVARPRGAAALIENPANIRTAVTAWRADLARWLGDRIDTPLDWEEAWHAPYFTGRPGWDGFGSLVLWAAYAEHPGRRCPEVLPEEWDNDPILMRSNADGFRSRYAHLLRHVELWLPNPFEFTFEGVNVDGRRIVVGSATALRRQLSELNAATWEASGATVVGWGRTPPAADASLEQRARYAFAVLSDLVQQATGHKLPMRLDY
ncbi:MAG: hypothetical protein J0H97_20775 [Alphaproteobacteria bacterium]|jgi:hypothetical protein|nr:hypothetical protein [Alphaproteobacteria bacterium]